MEYHRVNLLDDTLINSILWEGKGITTPKAQIL